MEGQFGEGVPANVPFLGAPNRSRRGHVEAKHKEQSVLTPVIPLAQQGAQLGPRKLETGLLEDFPAGGLGRHLARFDPATERIEPAREEPLMRCDPDQQELVWTAHEAQREGLEARRNSHRRRISQGVNMTGP